MHGFPFAGHSASKPSSEPQAMGTAKICQEPSSHRCSTPDLTPIDAPGLVLPEFCVLHSSHFQGHSLSQPRERKLKSPPLGFHGYLDNSWLSSLPRGRLHQPQGTSFLLIGLSHTRSAPGWLCSLGSLQASASGHLVAFLPSPCGA